MATLDQSVSSFGRSWRWIAVALGLMLIWVFVATPKLLRVRAPIESIAQDNSPAPLVSKPLEREQEHDSLKLTTAFIGPSAGAESGRKIVRTSSMSMVVQHPAEIAQRISVLAESLGGYLVCEDGGGQTATSGALTIRVPAAHFEHMRAEIRKLGLHVENEKVDAQDVTRQYVDQDASIRNLRAEEAQYLSILKQASTVKDLLAVSEKLSDVRGQIEQQEAEFNALSRQVETVSIAISLRTESEAQVAGLNWRPMYQLKMALRDGLESVANYATAMITILFYLPAVVLWTGTILATIAGGIKLIGWGRHWFPWKPAETSNVQ